MDIIAQSRTAHEMFVPIDMEDSPRSDISSTKMPGSTSDPRRLPPMDTHTQIQDLFLLQHQWSIWVDHELHRL